ERLAAAERLLGLGALGRVVVGRHGRHEVGVVVAGPLARLLVPPDVTFPLRPGPALGVGAGPVVKDAPVGRPGPGPLRRDPGLLPVGLAPCRLVLVPGGAAPGDAAAPRGGAVG